MKVQKLNFEGTDIPLSELVIIVGSNGVGKTTLLRDFYEQYKNTAPGQARMSGDAKWQDIFPVDSFKSNMTEWRNWSENIVKIEGIQTNNQSAYAAADSMSYVDGGVEYLYENDKQSLVGDVDNDAVTLQELEQRYGRAFKSQHAQWLPVDTRLSIANNPNGQLRNGYASDLRPAAFLALHKAILSQLNKSLNILFGKQLYIEPFDHPDYSIYVARYGTKKVKLAPRTTQGIFKAQEAFKAWRESTDVSSISNEGHGVRAAVEILYALENGRKKILFLDEPELHLYPSTKYNLGRIISSYAYPNKKQIILVTHDTELLRGLLNRSQNATVLRINSDKANGKKEIKSISSSSIKKSYSTDILQAAFQDCVLLVEGVRDKYVYGRAIAEKHLADDISMQVVSMYGKDSLSAPIQFYQQIGVKHAVIADFDILISNIAKRHLGDIMRAQGKTTSELANVEQLVDTVQAVLDGKQNKKRGLNATGLRDDDKESIQSALDLLKGHGIFVCPIGELEDWVGLPYGEVPEKVYATYKTKSNSVYKPLTDFLNEIVQYMKN